MNALEKYWYWRNSKWLDEDSKKELISIEDNREEIEERFCKELEFGTGGLRGILGAGTNRINKYTVRKATQGLSRYICQQKGEKRVLQSRMIQEIIRRSLRWKLPCVLMQMG